MRCLPQLLPILVFETGSLTDLARLSGQQAPGFFFLTLSILSVLGLQVPVAINGFYTDVGDPNSYLMLTPQALN